LSRYEAVGIRLNLAILLKRLKKRPLIPCLNFSGNFNMIVDKSLQKRPLVIDLDGPDGNAWALLARARSFARQLGLDGKKSTDGMIKSDYENLIQVFDNYFGDFVVLERSQNGF